MARHQEPLFSAENKAKALVLNHLIASKRINRSATVATEFVLGKSGTRADLALFGEELVGIEIKTARDNLRRLPSQMPAYLRHCHRTILAIAPKHLAGVKLMDLVGVELWLLLDDGSVRELVSPPVNTAIPEVVSLLTLEERRKLERDMQGLKRASVHELAVEMLGRRYAETSRYFWQSLGRKRVNAQDIEGLSRFRSERLAAAEWKARQEEHWASWRNTADAYFARA